MYLLTECALWNQCTEGTKKTHKIPRVLFFSRTYTLFSDTSVWVFFPSLYYTNTMYRRGPKRLKPLRKNITKVWGSEKSKLYAVRWGTSFVKWYTTRHNNKKKIKTRWSIVHILYRYMRSYVLVKAGPYIYGLLIPPDTVMRYISALVQQVVY